MSTKEKNEIISQIFMLLSKLVESDATNGESEITGLPVSSPTAAPVALPAEQRSAVPDEPMEMLTIKECTEAVRGISEHTVRKLVAQGRVRYIRTGEGERGKILISKKSLLEYFGGAA